MKKDKYLYNFEDTGETLFEKGLSDRSYHELLCYSRYLMFTKHLKRFVIKLAIENQFSGLTIFDEEKIDTVLNKVKDLGSLIIPHDIYFGYVYLLKSIENRKYRRLLYVMICLSKLDCSFPYYNRGINYANSFANTRMTKKELNEFEFLMNNLIVPVGIKNTKLILPNEYGNSIIVPYSNIMSMFPDFCEDCDEIIFRESNRQKVCKKCYKMRKNGNRH